MGSNITNLAAGREPLKQRGGSGVTAVGGRKAINKHLKIEGASEWALRTIFVLWRGVVE